MELGTYYLAAGKWLHFHAYSNHARLNAVCFLTTINSSKNDLLNKYDSCWNQRKKILFNPVLSIVYTQGNRLVFIHHIEFLLTKKELRLSDHDVAFTWIRCTYSVIKKDWWYKKKCYFVYIGMNTKNFKKMQILNALFKVFEY